MVPRKIEYTVMHRSTPVSVTGFLRGDVYQEAYAFLLECIDPATGVEASATYACDPSNRQFYLLTLRTFRPIHESQRSELERRLGIALVGARLKLPEMVPDMIAPAMRADVEE